MPGVCVGGGLVSGRMTVCDAGDAVMMWRGCKCEGQVCADYGTGENGEEVCVAGWGGGGRVCVEG